MNCFIATALGHPDVDAVYKHAIVPVLKSLKIRAIRIDRVEHNDDIDDRIFQLIDGSDLCIADLTYSRPSVYYEAGYAYGSKRPVVYIVRKDHFKARADDPPGNLRVHFDLQMKNIIPWTTANAEFKKRLRARLKYVTRPLFRKLHAAAAEEMHVKQFSSLSLHHQLRSLRDKAAKLLQRRGFAILPRKDSHMFRPDPFHLRLLKWRGNVSQQVQLVVRSSLKRSTVPYITHFGRSEIQHNGHLKLDRIESTHVLVSLSRVLPSTLRTLFPS